MDVSLIEKGTFEAELSLNNLACPVLSVSGAATLVSSLALIFSGNGSYRSSPSRKKLIPLTHYWKTILFVLKFLKI